MKTKYVCLIIVYKAFESMEAEQPIYTKGSQVWWTEVIRKTALEAGADEKGAYEPLHLTTQTQSLKLNSVVGLSSRYCDSPDEPIQLKGRLPSIQ